MTKTIEQLEDEKDRLDDQIERTKGEIRDTDELDLIIKLELRLEGEFIRKGRLLERIDQLYDEDEAARLAHEEREQLKKRVIIPEQGNDNEGDRRYHGQARSWFT